MYNWKPEEETELQNLEHEIKTENRCATSNDRQEMLLKKILLEIMKIKREKNLNG